MWAKDWRKAQELSSLQTFQASFFGNTKNLKGAFQQRKEKVQA
jgi:hypothetical protein